MLFLLLSLSLSLSLSRLYVRRAAHKESLGLSYTAHIFLRNPTVRLVKLLHWTGRRRGSAYLAAVMLLLGSASCKGFEADFWDTDARYWVSFYYSWQISGYRHRLGESRSAGKDQILGIRVPIHFHVRVCCQVAIQSTHTGLFCVVFV